MASFIYRCFNDQNIDGRFFAIDEDAVAPDGTVSVWHVTDSGVVEGVQDKFAGLMERSHPVTPDQAEELAQVLTAAHISGVINYDSNEVE
jgi:hypothetical protein